MLFKANILALQKGASQSTKECSMFTRIVFAVAAIAAINFSASAKSPIDTTSQVGQVSMTDTCQLPPSSISGSVTSELQKNAFCSHHVNTLSKNEEIRHNTKTLGFSNEIDDVAMAAILKTVANADRDSVILSKRAHTTPVVANSDEE